MLVCGGREVTRKVTHTEFGRVIAVTRKAYGMPAARHLAARINCTASRMESAEAGYRPLPVAIIRELVDLFDDAAFTLAAARYVTLGRVGIVAGALCGVRTAAAIAMAVELDELQEDLARVKAELLRDPAHVQRDTVKSVYSNVLDVIATCNQMLVELSRDYGLSLRDMQELHLREMTAKGYVSAKRTSRPLARTA